MSEITFAHPEYFFLLLIIPLYVAWYVWKQKEINPTIQISSLEGFKGTTKSWKSYLRHLPMVLRMLAITAVVATIARPQGASSYRDEKKEGIDIVIALDISSSMLAQDFTPNRVEAAKNVALEFVNNRVDDNIGLVVFAGEAFTQCPLTTDHAVLTNLFQAVKIGMLEDGTAIGLGLATAVSRIKDAKAKRKIIVLLTDGDNNRGSVSPLQAAEIAQTFGIRVYTVGIGSQGTAKIPVKTPRGEVLQEMEVTINEDLLQQIADMTGGQYHRASDMKSFKAVYEEIDKMEKTILEVREYTKRTEEYLPFALSAMIILLLEILLRNTVLRSIP